MNDKRDGTKQSEWHWQWSKAYPDSLNSFKNWICPNKIEDFKNKNVLDCGCGAGQHLRYLSPYCKKILGIDLNTKDIAIKNNPEGKNIEIIEGDISNIDLKEKFDIVYSIGVLHHTDDPSKSFNNIKKFVKKDGRLIIWAYSYEGNFIVRSFIEKIRKSFFSKMKRKNVWKFSKLITALFYIPIHSIYRLPLSFLPFYDYFRDWRGLNFKINNICLFDKLNAPQTIFIKKETIEEWFNKNEFKDVHIDWYNKVSWRASGTRI
ncbi:MAG: hypothetical protein CMH62_00610 [Nanoarchaeota archaeon]|nr:hypothetical protein [Nanoarchaeota archaeon]